MPTKRRVIIFLIVLSIMLLAKYAHGQATGGAPGWDNIEDSSSDIAYIAFAMIGGIVSGLFRAGIRHANSLGGSGFETGLIQLKLQ